MQPQRVQHVKFFAGVNGPTVQKLMETVQRGLSNGITRFVLLISSPGGEVFSGISAYNFLKGIPAEVHTHNFGSADSIATILFCAGAKRMCVPHARFLLHGIGFNVQAPSRFDEKILDEKIKDLRIDRENISKIIADNTKKPLEAVERDMLQGTALNSQQAVEYGLVHEIKSELFEQQDAQLIDITG